MNMRDLAAKLGLCLMVAALAAVVFVEGVRAQEAAEATGEKPVPEASASGEPRTLDRGDNAWMLTSSALVLFMTSPGLAISSVAIACSERGGRRPPSAATI